MRSRMSVLTDPELPPRSRFERRKAVIVRAAVPIINDKGVRGMTLAEVAGQLNLVPTAVNYYFRRKEDLAAACFQQAIAHYNDLIDRSIEESAAEDRLRAFLHEFANYVAAVDTGGARPIAVFNDVRTIGDAGVNAAYVEMFRRFRRTFSAESVDHPVPLRRNARAHLLISQVFWAVLWLRQYDPADYRRMIDRLSDILINGLAAPGASWVPVDLPRAEDLIETAGGSREAFLRVATEMINEHGYPGASVSRISARLNVTKGSFYHHIQAKDDLIEQCFGRTLDITRRAQVTADACTTTGLDNLSSLAASMVSRDVSREVPLLRTSALTAVPEGMRSKFIRRFERISARLASVVSDGVADGSIRPVDTNVAAQTITALINASAELHHWAPGVNSANAAEVYARPLFMGLFGKGHVRTVAPVRIGQLTPISATIASSEEG